MAEINIEKMAQNVVQKIKDEGVFISRWIPVKWHEITDEERKENDYPKEWACYLDSIMPYDGQRILVTTKGGYVELDECYSDDGQTFSLDSGYDWVDDVVAWMPLPEPYEPQENETWNGIHAQITAPKGTFERIFNDADDDNDI